ncbi:MAG: hypothetical protein A2648_00130 [Candidatus Lloydbacteria bacterium RIFCSPHIGHO2_01_FULL_41_20]|uniref:Uncharacterized protein n=1 Tax=Candidatus Lloydbacteria bacterium RIFCSPHIGHO2_01_FULL_41_20 TaxID=1798657 RepID=A0A1G2CRI4_9BACT|nr:MAG: hypothetical protein A2648_00130 [Candidatus Lloydbacteria bacterium RIFCSPHIGHO2_01_FULL_41_20]
MINWLKGFGFGLMMILTSLAIIFFANGVVITMTGAEIAKYHLFVMLFLTWFIEVIILIPYGSIPLKITWNAFVARSVFVWGPVGVGWYLAHHMSALVFWLGLIISSTCVGYNIVVTNVQKKT